MCLERALEPPFALRDGAGRAAPSGTSSTASALGVALVPQEGHAIEAVAVAYSRDGRFIATGGFDQSLRVWDGDGVLRESLHCDGEKVSEIAFSPRREAVAGACGGRVSIWELASGKLRASFGENVVGFAWSPDGAHVATAGHIDEGSRAPLLDIWSAKNGALERRVSAPRGRQLLSVDWSPNGATLVTGSLDGEGALWDAATLAPSALPISARGWRVAFSPDGSKVAALGANGLAVVDLATAAETPLGPVSGGGDFAWRADGDALAVDAGGGIIELRDARASKGQGAAGGPSVLARVRNRLPLERLALAPDGSTVATVGVDDPVVRVLDVADSHEIHALGADTVERRAVTFSPDGMLLAVTGAAIEIWNPHTGALVRTLDAHGRRVGGTSFSPDGAHLVAQVTRDTAQIWSTATFKVEATITVSNAQDEGWALSWLPDGPARSASTVGPRRPLLVAAVGKELRRWTPGEAPARIALDGGPWITALSVSPDGGTLAVASRSHVVLADTTSFQPRARLDLDSWGWFFEPTWSRDGKLLATSAGPSIQIWSAADGRLLGTTGDRGMFASPAFSPDGHWLAFSGRDKTLDLWPSSALAGASLPERSGTGSVMARRPSGALSLAFPGVARALAFSPDGGLIAAGSDEREIVLWDARRGRRLWSDRHHGARVGSLAWHPRGVIFASASTSVRLYRAADGAAVTLSTAALPRGRHAAYAYSDAGTVSGEPDALASLRFRTSSDAIAGKLAAFEAVATAVHRPKLMEDFWAGDALDR